MAMANACVWQFNASSTANMVNGGGFNNTNANFIADFTATNADTASPVLSSATYAFLATDVGAWIFVANGTNWTKGLYQIASVTAGAATINAAIGAAVVINANTGFYDTASTVAGIATVPSPTVGTVGIDYSQGTAANTTNTDLSCLTGSTTVISLLGAFTPVHVGNIIHITVITGVGATVGWYEIVSYINATSVILDRTPSATNNATLGTYNVGGSLDLAGAIGTSFGSQVLQAGNTIWFKSGNYTMATSTTWGGSVGTGVLPTYMLGFTSLRGDACNGLNRPLISTGAALFTNGPFMISKNLSFTGTATSIVTMSGSSTYENCKFTNTSTTATRGAITTGTDGWIMNCEFVSQNGVGISINGQRTYVIDCYIHDCLRGIIVLTFGQTIINNIIESCSGSGIFFNSTTASAELCMNNTIYGTEAKRGNGLDFVATALFSHCINNILYGLTNGAIQATTQSKSNFGRYNNFFNNTTDVTLFYKDPTDVAINPLFVSVSQITSSTGTTSGSVWTDTGANYTAVTDNVDYAYVISGTGKTVGKYLITAHTATTLTFNNAPGTNATADGVLTITIGHNLRQGATMNGFPGVFQAGFTTSNTQIGAVQRSSGSSVAISQSYAG